MQKQGTRISKRTGKGPRARVGRRAGFDGHFRPFSAVVPSIALAEEVWRPDSEAAGIRRPRSLEEWFVVLATLSHEEAGAALEGKTKGTGISEPAQRAA